MRVCECGKDRVTAIKCHKLSWTNICINMGCDHVKIARGEEKIGLYTVQRIRTAYAKYKPGLHANGRSYV